ncbi:hypothetical protein [Pseudomonas sp.]|uniref:hypothetical protein n=1 Tax=Pseudomonas sp. TaxID=306 RepID=UPI0026DCB8A4|nr:hypothetical protein [Pseudomonas sp.]MDO4235529.1 hypothetical protein [Pseudomonas sp.]
MFSTTEGLAAITSRTVSDAQGKGGNIGRLSDDDAIIAILGCRARYSALSGKKRLFWGYMFSQYLRCDVTKLAHEVETF